MKALRDRRGNRIRQGDKVVADFGDEASVCVVEELGRTNLTVSYKGKRKKLPAESVLLYRRKPAETHQEHNYQPGQWVRIKGKWGWVGKVNFLVNRTTVSVLVPPQENGSKSWQEPVCPVDWLEPAEKPDYL